jgi:hypothetical protein
MLSGSRSPYGTVQAPGRRVLISAIIVVHGIAACTRTRHDADRYADARAVATTIAIPSPAWRSRWRPGTISDTEPGAEPLARAGTPAFTRCAAGRARATLSAPLQAQLIAYSRRLAASNAH